MDLLSVLIMLVVLLALAKVGSMVFTRFGVPGLVGEILIGVLIANLVIGDTTILEMLGIFIGSEGVDPSSNYVILYTLAEIGVIFLLFAVGLETRAKDLMSVGKAAFLVAILGVVLPFILGFIVIMVKDGNMLEALFLGAAMVATSVGITARVIKDMKLSDARESRIIIGAAVIDDILGMIILAIVVGMAKAETSGEALSIVSIATIAIVAVAFVVVVLLYCLKINPILYNKIMEYKQAKLAKADGKPIHHMDMFAIAIIVCLALSALAEIVGLAAIIGAFLAGMIFADHAHEWKLEAKVESITDFILPLFFINVGLMVNLSAFTNVDIIVLSLIVIVLAVISKLVGCGLGAKLGDKSLDKDSCRIIGVGMIPRGEVGIIVATIGYSTYHILTPELYSVVIFMSVVTTIIAPPILSKMFRKKYPEDMWADAGI